MSLCLSCEYEPDWSEPVGVEYKRQSGKCKYIVNWPSIPWVYLITTRPLIRYSDDSGLPTACKTYKPKES